MKKFPDRLFSWASILDENAEAQARTSATLPFSSPHIALMPDAHLGLRATAGSVIPTLRAVIQVAVGADIDCGMIAAKTQFSQSDLPSDLRMLREQIERAVPTSAKAYNNTSVWLSRKGAISARTGQLD